jgi:hypothetical protein
LEFGLERFGGCVVAQDGHWAVVDFVDGVLEFGGCERLEVGFLGQ